MDQTIEPKIRPLVDALNAIDGVRIDQFHDGNVWGGVGPFIDFDAPLRVARKISFGLVNAYHKERLTHWWSVSGRFDCNGRLYFSVHSPRLDQKMIGLRRFAIHRGRIDRDLSVLANFFHGGLDHRNGVSHGGEEDDTPDHDDGDSGYFPHGQAAADGIVDQNRPAAEVTPFELTSHRNTCPSCHTGKISRGIIGILFLAVAVSACAGPTELQKDGSGTDEMLKSPCACLPVLYDGPLGLLPVKGMAAVSAPVAAAAASLVEKFQNINKPDSKA